MFQYKKIVTELLEENTYILYNEDKECIIIDPGYGFKLIDSFIFSNNLSVDADNVSLSESQKNVIPASKLAADKPPIILEHNNIVENRSETFYFSFSSTQVERLSIGENKRLTGFVSRCNNKIHIVGHTCNVGSEAVNYQLGLARATAMYHYLIRQGSNPDILTVRSEGMGQPFESNTTKSGRKLNRRVELLCIKD